MTTEALGTVGLREAEGVCGTVSAFRTLGPSDHWRGAFTPDSDAERPVHDASVIERALHARTGPRGSGEAEATAGCIAPAGPAACLAFFLRRAERLGG